MLISFCLNFYLNFPCMRQKHNVNIAMNIKNLKSLFDRSDTCTSKIILFVSLSCFFSFMRIPSITNDVYTKNPNKDYCIKFSFPKTFYTKDWRLWLEIWNSTWYTKWSLGHQIGLLYTHHYIPHVKSYNILILLLISIFS